MIKIVSVIDNIKQFKAEWNVLFENDKYATPFQSFDYLSASLEFFEEKEEKLYFVFIKDGLAKLWVAVFPFIIDRNGVLRFINTLHTDFCGPLIMPGYDNYNLYKELADYIKKDSCVKGLELYNIKGSYNITDVLSPYFPYLIIYNCNHYSIISILKESNDKDCIDSIRTIPSKKKWNHRKILKELPENTSFRLLSQNSKDEFPSQAIHMLCNKMVNLGIRTNEYFSENMFSFWKALYESNVLTVALIYDSNNVKAANLMLYDSKRNEFISWITLYVGKSWNLAINIKIVEHIYNNGGGGINFARGIYDYKLTNFHPDVKPLFCVKIAKTRWGHFKNIVSIALHYSKPIIKSFLRR